MEITNLGEWRRLVSKQLNSQAEILKLIHIELIKLGMRIKKLEVKTSDNIGSRKVKK